MVQEEEINQYFISHEQLDTPGEGSESLSLKEAVSDCVNHHEMILQFAKKLEDYFCWFLLPKLCYSGEDNLYRICNKFKIIKLSNFKPFLSAASHTYCQQ